MQPPMEMQAPEVPEENPTPQFQLVLRTVAGDQVIAASDTVNDMVEQAKIWLNATDAGAAITDASVRSIILQEVDPATGAYVDGEELPVDSKQDVVAQARNLGIR